MEEMSSLTQLAEDLESLERTQWQVDLGPGRLLFGSGRLRELGSAARDLGARSVLLVTDPGVRAAGWVAVAEESLRTAGVGSIVFDGVAENPTTRHVDAGVAFATGRDIDCVVGLGGGSSMDCAKAINLLLTNGGRMEDYWGFNKATKPLLPSIGLPCTAGTGSEAQSFALIAQEDTHIKMACGDEKARFDVVILDPLLVVTAPDQVVAVAGFDALSHAVESYVTRSGNPVSRLYAREAWRLLDASYEKLVGGQADDESWADQLLGAHLAGAAIESSMLGAAHALANPLTASWGVTHGVAVGLMLPAVVRANALAVDHLYAELFGETAGLGLANRLEELRRLAGLPTRLVDVGVPETALGALADEALLQWTLRHNPRAFDRSEVLALYQGVLR